MNVRTKLSVVLLLITTSLLGQDLEEIENNKVVQITTNELKDLFITEESKFNLIYSYASWCKSCEKSIDDVLKISQKESIKLYPIIIDRVGSFFFEKTIESLYLKHNYSGEVFKPSSKYGKGYSKSYNRFIQELIPEAKDFGLSFFALFDNSGKLLYSSTYNIPSDKSIAIIKDLTKIKE